MHFKLNDRFRLQITVQGNAYAKPSPAKGKGKKGKAVKASKTISKAPVKATTTVTKPAATAKATTAAVKPARGSVARAARSGLSKRGGVKPSLNLSLARGGAPASTSTKPKASSKAAAPKPWENKALARAQATPFSPAVEVLAPEGVPPAAAANPAAAVENELSKYTSPSTPFLLTAAKTREEGREGS